jgi:hypothetical protein
MQGMNDGAFAAELEQHALLLQVLPDSGRYDPS